MLGNHSGSGLGRTTEKGSSLGPQLGSHMPLVFLCPPAGSMLLLKPEQLSQTKCPNLEVTLGCGFPGFWQLQARPGHGSNRSLYQSKVIQLPGLGSNPSQLQSPGDDAGAGYSSEKHQSPSQVTQSQRKPGAGWEVALGEVTIP